MGHELCYLKISSFHSMVMGNSSPFRKPLICEILMCSNPKNLNRYKAFNSLQILAIEFVAFAIEFVPLAIEFVALARKFVMTE